MTKNPLINALAGLAYIVIIVLVLQLAPRNTPDTILDPIAALSTFVLSASIMGYIFLYKPAVIFLDGDRKGGLKLFLQTVLIFAIGTGVLVALAFSRILVK